MGLKSSLVNLKLQIIKVARALLVSVQVLRCCLVVIMEWRVWEVDVFDIFYGATNPSIISYHPVQSSSSNHK